MRTYILLIIGFCGFSTSLLGQSVKIKWSDKQGREFSVTAPDGEFGYSIIAGDQVFYDTKNKVSLIGNTNVVYRDEKVILVGNISINYDYKGRVFMVGGLVVNYDANGRFSGTYGKVN